jgi:arginase
MKRSLQLYAKTVSVISVPMNLGQPFLGPDQTPKLMKENGLSSLLTSCGWRIDMEPDIISAGSPALHIPDRNVVLGTAKNCAEVGYVCEKVFHVVKRHAETDNFVLILGGDHCIPIGTIPGLLTARKNTGVVWVDAHADINVPATSNSGNMHGQKMCNLIGTKLNELIAETIPLFLQECLSPF